MKTNKTFDEYWEPDGICPKSRGKEIWNAALASIVQEPALTEEEIAPLVEAALARIEGVKSWHPHTAASIAHYLAGRIPASKPDDQERLKNYEAVLRSIGAPEILCTGEMGQLAELDEDDMAWAREQGKKIAPTPARKASVLALAEKLAVAWTMNPGYEITPQQHLDIENYGDAFVSRSLAIHDAVDRAFEGRK